MTDVKVITKEPIPITHIEKLLKGKKKEERAEVQNKLLDYAKKVSKMTEAEANKLIEELEGMAIPGLTKEEIVSLANIAPATLSELRAMLSGKANLSPENFKKILEVLQKHTKEK